MDRNSVIGLFLIAAILITFMLMNNNEDSTQENEDKSQQEQSEVVLDSTEKKVEQLTELAPLNDSLLIAVLPDSLKTDSTFVTSYLDSIHKSEENKMISGSGIDLVSEYGMFAKSAVEQETKLITLENDKLLLTFSTKGGNLVSVKLKEYQSYKDYIDNPDSINPLQLVNESNSKFGISFLSDANMIKTDQLYFAFEGSESHINVSENDSSSIKFKLLTDDPSKYIEFTYSLSYGMYDVDFDVEYVNLKNIDEIQYEQSYLYWDMKGLSTEKLASDERNTATLMYRYTDEKRDYLSERGNDEEELTSKTNWVAFKHKFFSSAIICEEGFKGGKVKQAQIENDDFTVAYSAKLDLPASSVIHTKLFFGPNEYNTLAAYDNGMEDIINLGWGIFGWVNKWFIQPIFDLLRSWGLAMGLIIFLVTLMVKIVITPLTYKNYISSAKMKVLKPEIDKINEKYPGQDQMMKRQQETSALYRSSGVNPMAGCIPMLIQMPILLAVFRFFPSSIYLRHKSFLWADDLSSYDSIFSWTGDIPLLTSIYGNHISLFTLLMAASTLIYTIMNSGNMAQPSQPGMPNMKVIMYIFPFLMIFFFNKFSAGLSYYYLCGNLFNIGIMYGIKKYFIDEDKLRSKIEDNKKTPKKKNKFMERLEAAQKQQMQMQQQKKK